MQVIIPNDISIVSHNLGNSSQQKNNGTFPLDPSIYDKSKSPFYQIGDSVVSGDKIFRQIINPNAIPNANAIEGQPRFETLRDLAERIANLGQVSSAIISVRSDVSIAIGLTGEFLPLDIKDGVLSGQITISLSQNRSWNGELSLFREGLDAITTTATRAPNDGASNALVQHWNVNVAIGEVVNKYVIMLMTNPNLRDIITDFTFTGTLSYQGKDIATALTDLKGYLDPRYLLTNEDGTLQNNLLQDLPTGREFINDIAWWVEIRAVNGESFIDKRPKIKTGRYGAVQVQVSSETPFDSVALVNCECLEAEVEGNMLQSCQVQGADTTRNRFLTSFSLSLTCIGNAPSEGTGLVDGVITISNGAGNFTWDGVVKADRNPAQFTATRMPNDGANDATEQRWIVKGAVLDFTKAGLITIDNIIGGIALTGSFEGVVSYEGNTTITLSPDAPHEPSDLLFTDLQPIANDAGIYTATINIKADDATIPTATNTTKRPFASLGQIVLGKHATIWEENTTKPEIGDTDIDSFSKTFIDFSKVERNEYGDITTTPRESTWGIDATAKFPRHKAKAIERIISNLGGAKPAVFYQSNMITDGTLLYGYIANAGITFRQGDNKYQQCKISIEGLV